MKKLLLYLQNRQTQMASVLLFVLSVAFVVYLNPREAKFKYEFQKGKPWLYENLVAPFDFAVVKSSEELEKERKQLRNNKTLFLVREEGLKTAALSQFEKEISRKWRLAKDSGLLTTNTSPSLAGVIQNGKKIISHIYDKGVLKPIESDVSRNYGEILLTEKGISKAVSFENFYTIKEAAMYARTNLPYSSNEEVYNLVIGVIINNLDYNILFDENTTNNYLKSQLDNILPTKGLVQRGELVIFKGNLVDDEKFAKLSSLRQAYEGSFSTKASLYYILFGQILLVSILFLVLFLFLYQFRQRIMEDVSKLTFILVNVLLMVFMAKIVMDFGVEYIYLAPFPILPIVIRSFFDTRIALFVHMVAMLLIGFLVPNSFEFIFLQFIAGIFAIILVNNLYKRGQLFFTAAKIIAVYCLSYLSMAIIQEGSFKQIEMINFAYFAGNGFLTLISFPLIYMEEKLFGFVSDVSLLELSDTNNPLLRELAQKAPGTFQHSLQVANLAEAAVLSINGNALLVRTGALYHDIGKMTYPMYFIENQHTGLNPHDELSFEESAQMIIGHVKEGIKIAKKNNLPDVLIDFIRTHHGTTTVMYFYKQYIKNFPEQEVDLKKFTYPGPKPFSKETAALMMADSVEAASRSMNKPDHDNIDKLVESIIDHQMESGQFENAEITLREIKDIKKIFKKMLMNIYHVRIQYPE
ncbi:MAG TPA: phosphohydrolase [Cryomorphaceae bacterium]|nr:phosphohydrolase [Owenweeksia sp.]MBF97379.1 phosphohydrolase [Owenweeksia sp.]HAD95851.1 phosphohydrolase [Cryomorphaceae bacterium]HBF18568.1 phosphohydrolase [Cryomorphaceae bacterium]